MLVSHIWDEPVSFQSRPTSICRIAVSAILLAVAGGDYSLSVSLSARSTQTSVTSRCSRFPYSHKLHAGNLGLDCRYCHSTIERFRLRGHPAHRDLHELPRAGKPQSPLLQLVRESYATGQPIPWVHIHKLPDYVYFNHQAHLNAGVSCVSCHGRVDQMAEVRQVKPLSMAWCLECHRNPAPNDPARAS